MPSNANDSAMDKLYTIHAPTECTLEVKKSLFIAHLVPIAEFQRSLELLRESHKKARHFVWATRQLNKFAQIVENCTDDGEPRNTSGKPTLKVLEGHDIVNAGIITVRYFGGIKLGTGGLVRAYNDAAQQAVQEAELIPLSCLYEQTICLTYQQMRHADYLLKQHPIKVIHKEFTADHVTLTVQGEETVIAEAFSKLETPSDGSLKIEQT